MSTYVPFTKQEFEDALPKRKSIASNSQFLPPLWRCLGIVTGEYVYAIDIPEQKSAVFIYSTVTSNGISAPKGADSVRMWLGDIRTRQPLAPKLSHHLARTKNLFSRIDEQAWELYNIGKKIGVCGCGSTKKVNTVVKEGANKGRLFIGCPNRCTGVFEWLD
jgi:hypothetical protein